MLALRRGHDAAKRGGRDALSRVRPETGRTIVQGDPVGGELRPALAGEWAQAAVCALKR